MTTTVDIRIGFDKLFEIIHSLFGPSIIRRRAVVDNAARLSSTETDIAVRMLGIKAEYEEKKSRLLLDRDFKQLETQLRLESLPQVIEQEIPITIEWPTPNIVVADTHDKPFEYVEHRRLQNIKHVTEEAIRALPAHETISEKPVELDWTARFFDNVKDISNEDMQRLWGKLLAGEIANPGRFSLRTLDILRNITSEEARAFATLSEMFCTLDSDAGLLLFPSATTTRFGKLFEKLLLIEDAGLMKMIPLAQQMDSGNSSQVSFKGLDGMIEKIEGQQQLLIDCFALTAAGKQLFPLVTGAVSMDYVAFLHAQLRGHGYGLLLRVLDSFVEAPLPQQ